MPQLPSGRHIAIHAPSAEQIAQSIMARLPESEQNNFLESMHKIRTAEDVAPYMEVLFFREVADISTQSPDLYDPKFDQPQVSIEPYRSGFTLADQEKFTADWSPVDKAAFQTFLAEERMQSYFKKTLDQVIALDKALTRDFVSRFVEMLWKAGLHPLQEVAELGIEPRTNPNIDLYDLLAALCRLTASHDAQDDHYHAHAQAFDQIAGFVRVMLGHYPALIGALPRAASLDDLAEQWRQNGALDALSAEDQQWFWRSAHVVVVSTFAMFDDEKLKRAYPKEWEICQLAYVSRETADLLNDARKHSAGDESA